MGWRAVATWPWTPSIVAVILGVGSNYLTRWIDGRRASLSTRWSAAVSERRAKQAQIADDNARLMLRSEAAIYFVQLRIRTVEIKVTILMTTAFLLSAISLLLASSGSARTLVLIVAVLILFGFERFERLELDEIDRAMERLARLAAEKRERADDE
jgi:dihydroxyacid dehydratase/phosphogluconate dehydratase